MPEDLVMQVADVLGRAMLTEAYRELFLSVADRTAGDAAITKRIG